MHWQTLLASLIGCSIGSTLGTFLVARFARRDWEQTKRRYSAELDLFAAAQKQRYAEAVDAMLAQLETEIDEDGRT